MELLNFENDSPLIVASNYWESSMAKAGKLYLSLNAGCFRLLVPQILRSSISDMRPGAKHIVVSVLPRDKWREREFSVEWMVEDGSAEGLDVPPERGQDENPLGAGSGSTERDQSEQKRPQAGSAPSPHDRRSRNRFRQEYHHLPRVGERRPGEKSVGGIARAGRGRTYDRGHRG